MMQATPGHRSVTPRSYCAGVNESGGAVNPGGQLMAVIARGREVARQLRKDACDLDRELDVIETAALPSVRSGLSPAPSQPQSH